MTTKNTVRLKNTIKNFHRFKKNNNKSKYKLLSFYLSLVLIMEIRFVVLTIVIIKLTNIMFGTRGCSRNINVFSLDH